MQLLFQIEQKLILFNNEARKAISRLGFNSLTASTLITEYFSLNLSACPELGKVKRSLSQTT